MSFVDQITLEEYQKQAKYYTKDMVRSLEKELTCNPKLSSPTYYLNRALMQLRTREALIHHFVALVTFVGFLLFLAFRVEPLAANHVHESLTSLACNVPHTLVFTTWDAATIAFVFLWVVYLLIPSSGLPLIKPFYSQLLGAIGEYVNPLVEETCIASIAYMFLRASGPNREECSEQLSHFISNSTEYHARDEILGVGIRLAHFSDTVLGSNESSLERDGFWSAVWGMYLISLTASTLRKVTSMPPVGATAFGLLIIFHETLLHMEWFGSIQLPEGERVVLYLLLLNWFLTCFPVFSNSKELKLLNEKKEVEDHIVRSEQQEIQEILDRPEIEENEELESEEDQAEEEGHSFNSE